MQLRTAPATARNRTSRSRTAALGAGFVAVLATLLLAASVRAKPSPYTQTGSIAAYDADGASMEVGYYDRSGGGRTAQLFGPVGQETIDWSFGPDGGLIRAAPSSARATRRASRTSSGHIRRGLIPRPIAGTSCSAPAPAALERTGSSCRRPASSPVRPRSSITGTSPTRSWRARAGAGDMGLGVVDGTPSAGSPSVRRRSVPGRDPSTASGRTSTTTSAWTPRSRPITRASRPTPRPRS